jgi:hypothetical protein
MRTLYLLIVINVALISACTSTNNTLLTDPQPQTKATPKVHHKDPINVSLYPGIKEPARPYKVLGKTSVSKFNPVGIKRQEATIRDLMREDAVSLGGDAVIALTHGEKEISGTVISYERILV